MPPERLGRYALGDRIGEGGMGVVYRARLDGPEGFSRLVAIKRIHDHLARDPGIREAFVAEATTAQRLHHGNIVSLIEVGFDDGAPYLVLEYVDGASLAELLRGPAGRGGDKAQPLAIADALAIAESVAAALAYTHGLADAEGRPEGLVHRDVTPRNIMISRDGVVKLADFGIAKALTAPSYTLPGTFKGSLGYLAPEQARGESACARADQFSLGIVLHEMLAGKNPIAVRDIETYHRALAAGVRPLVAPLPADAELAAILARATAIAPAARYGSMDELRSELEAWRVARKIRTSGESLRTALRERLGAERAPAAAAPRPLGDVLGDQMLLNAPTLPIAPAARGKVRAAATKRRRLAIAGAGLAGLVGLGCAALLFAGRRGETAHLPETVPAPAPAPTAAAAAPQPAAPQPAAPQPAAPQPAAPQPAAGQPAAPPAPAPPRPAQRQPGRLQVNVVPWATVLLDERPLGGVPIDVEVAAGRHRVTLHNPDTGDRVEKTIEIRPGEAAQVTSW